MKIERIQIKNPSFNGERCYVHARGLIMPDGFGIMTMQKLELSGCDVFYGLEMTKTDDFGESFSPIVYCENLKRRYLDDGSSYAMSDATPFYHKKTGKIILTGHKVMYSKDNALLGAPRPRSTMYSVYNEATGDFEPFREVVMPDGDKYFSSGAGCSQILETESGELLIPIYFSNLEASRDPLHTCTYVTVMRCSFDGEEIRCLETGNEMTVDVPRGLGEPSIVKFGDEYLLSIRNDETSYVTKSKDGLNYEAPTPLCFDDGSNLGSYNTQTHWLVGGGKPWLVYTRRGANNDHVSRNRAPLFIAEFDPERMCVIRETERVAVPERGARLGNFGCQSFSDEVGYVYAAEWMQGPEKWQGCMKHGSDNTVWVAKITY